MSQEHDESYFASFTDMLVGIIFIFIILLMIVANNYQEATESVKTVSKTLEEERNKTRDEARDRAHDAAQTEAIAKLTARLQAAEESKNYEQAKALELASALEQAKAAMVEKPVQDTKAFADPTAAKEAKANDDVLIRRLRETQQNIFNDSRAKILRRIQETMNMQGFNVTGDPARGILLVPENILFDSTQGAVNYRGKQTMYTLSAQFNKYLPCIAPTADQNRLRECAVIGVTPNDGLDAIFIDDYPTGSASREEKLVLAVQRIVSIFKELKMDEPYLDTGLKNTAGAPVLNVKVNQERRKARQDVDNPALQNFVVFRVIMRQPNPADIAKLRAEKP